MKHRFTLIQFVRIVIILIFSWVVSFYFPAVVLEQPATLTNPTFGLIMYVFIAGFLITQSYSRHRDLDESIAHELSRLRRIVHLTHQLSTTKVWKSSVRRAVVTYLLTVAGRRFTSYDGAHDKFREITHLIYEYKPKTGRCSIIFSELLSVTRDLSFQRQRVAQQIFASVSPHTWTVLVLILVINIILLLGSRELGFTSPLFIAGAISGLLLVLDVLYELDSLTSADQKAYSRLYQQNARDMSGEAYDKKHRKH